MKINDNMDAKYIVAPLTGGNEGVQGIGSVLEPDTFFVLKETDPFAVEAMYAYVHAIATVITLDQDRSFLKDDERVRLERLHDGAVGLVETWLDRSSFANRLPC